MFSGRLAAVSSSRAPSRARGRGAVRRPGCPAPGRSVHGALRQVGQAGVLEGDHVGVGVGQGDDAAALGGVPELVQPQLGRVGADAFHRGAVRLAHQVAVPHGPDGDEQVRVDGEADRVAHRRPRADVVGHPLHQFVEPAAGGDGGGQLVVGEHRAGTGQGLQLQVRVVGDGHQHADRRRLGRLGRGAARGSQHREQELLLGDPGPGAALRCAVDVDQQRVYPWFGDLENWARRAECAVRPVAAAGGEPVGDRAEVRGGDDQGVPRIARWSVGSVVTGLPRCTRPSRPVMVCPVVLVNTPVMTTSGGNCPARRRRDVRYVEFDPRAVLGSRWRGW